MNEVCTNPVLDTSEQLIRAVEPVDMFLGLVAGGTVSVTRLANRNDVATGIGRNWGKGDLDCIVVELDKFGETDRHDSVYLDPDQNHEIDAIDRAIAALRAAREAFVRTSEAFGS